MARFENPPGSPRRTSLVTRLPVLIGRFVVHGLRRQDRSHVLPRSEAAAQLAAFAGRDSLTWIGHMTVLLRLDGRTILADPWWANYASPIPGLGPRRLAPAALGINDLPPVDVVIVSHVHRDHLDLEALARLPDRHRITAVVPLGVGRYFERLGYGRVVELDWHADVEVAGTRFTALPAIHWSQRGLFSHNATLWSAFAIEGPSGRRIYFGGDSDYGPVYAETARRWRGFDLALISIGGFPAAGSHCRPPECARIAAELGARTVVPLHWGTLYLGESKPLELPLQFREAAIANGIPESRVWIMRIGETRGLEA